MIKEEYFPFELANLNQANISRLKLLHYRLRL